MRNNSTKTWRRVKQVALLLAGGQTLLLLGLLPWSTPQSNDGPSTNHSQNSTRGIYSHDAVAEMPWSIHVLKIDRTRRDWELQTTLGKGTSIGMATVSEQMKSLPPQWGRPVAAVNGDFYHNDRNYPGDPDGLQIAQGELVSAPSATHICFWIDPAGKPHRSNVLSHFKVTWPDGSTSPFGLNEERASDAAVLYTAAIGESTRTSGGLELLLERKGSGPWLPLQIGQTYTARVREVGQTGNAALNRETMVLSLGPKLQVRATNVASGAVLKISTATTPDLTGTKTAIGGGPTLVAGGKTMRWNGSPPRHPRTALGWNKDYFFLVEVDGRQPNLSVGMSFPELADYMAKLGCEEAMNLDGGGSATCWLLGTVMNSPSEGKERPAANALVLIQKNKPQK